MHRFIKCLLIVLILLLETSTAMAEPVFRVVYNNEENPPRIMGDGTAINWSQPGLSIEQLKMVEEMVGVPFQFRRLPWKRCLYTLQNSAADAVVHASYKPAREDYGVYPTMDRKLDPSRSLFKMAYVLYVKKSSDLSWDGQTIRNATRPIGTQLSYSIADDLRDMGFVVEEEANIVSNLNKLIAGRISAYADVESIVDNQLSKLGPRCQAIEKRQPPLREKVYYLLI